MRDDAFAPDGCAFACSVAQYVVEARVCGIANDGAGDLRVVLEGGAIAGAADAQPQRCHIVAEKDEAALGAGEPQRVLDHGAEHIVQHLRAVEALGRFQKEGELFEIRSTDLAGGALQQLAGTGDCVGREAKRLVRRRIVQEDERYGGMPKRDAVAGAKPYPLDALVVAQRAVTAAEVAKIQAVRLRLDAGVLPRDLRVRHAQMALAAAP